jgi:hypothetical protein
MPEPTPYELMNAIDRLERLIQDVARDVGALENRMDRTEDDVSGAERDIVKLNRDVVAIENALNNLSNRR